MLSPKTELARLSRRTMAGLERARAAGKVLDRPVKPLSLVLETARLAKEEAFAA